jgi:hypothetical protein
MLFFFALWMVISKENWKKFSLLSIKKQILFFENAKKQIRSDKKKRMEADPEPTPTPERTPEPVFEYFATLSRRVFEDMSSSAAKTSTDPFGVLQQL